MEKKHPQKKNESYLHFYFLKNPSIFVFGDALFIENPHDPALKISFIVDSFSRYRKETIYLTCLFFHTPYSEDPLFYFENACTPSSRFFTKNFMKQKLLLNI